MWTFDGIPVARIEAAYGVTLDRTWLDAVQASAVRLTNGCSAGLVSGEGLAVTNGHCVADCAQALSSSGDDYVQDGFLTEAREDERKCPGLQAEVLLTIIDVTDQVRLASEGKAGRDFVQARDGALAVAELAACGQDQTLRCQAIGFFRGGQYKVYKYRRYNDVRLVFMPEMASASFGGDPDNFNFPRYAFDIGFVRLYVDDAPAATPTFLPWRGKPPADGEPTFVVGNPGSTERQLTVAQLETQRDVVLPMLQLQRAELRGRLIQFGRDDADQARAASQALAWVQNSYKLSVGKQAALNDPAFLDAKRADDAALRAKVAADPKLADTTGAWDEIAKAQPAAADLFPALRMLETGAGGGSELYYYARLLVRAALERAKPEAERLPEYADARLPLIERKLADAPPIDPALERIYLEHWLLKTREALTVDAPRVRALLGRDSPERLAEALSGSALSDPEVRMALWKGGLAAVEASDDPLVRFVLRADPIARAARAAYEARVSGPVDIAAEKIAKARVAVLGDGAYPDATFSLRLSYGKVAGWKARGEAVRATTTFAGFYDRVTGVEPFAAAPRWLEAKGRLKSDTVFDFVSTNDIIGGNSGSPVLDAKGRLMGVAFDGNLPSLGGAYGYDGARNRTISVSAVAIVEALSKVYGRDALVKELTGR
ncbi:S46 family peptidase [Caulobacter sp. RL271]|uniref:Dipeptidyl-peptidase n=1 Tax=Caulobacter segnis TaxID=88688 RepID=A0ABY4ZYP5_9CAUL|nr:S46 family peptidase [Caulobacter segnis]USQ97678.1 S46 family peptidase [Caulobacter segnis]